MSVSSLPTSVKPWLMAHRPDDSGVISISEGKSAPCTIRASLWSASSPGSLSSTRASNEQRPRVAVVICRFRRVEADGSFAILDRGHLLGFDEEDLGLRIEKSSDQPAGCRPVDVDAFTRHP